MFLQILVVIEPLLIDEDYYARVEGREIISNLAKVRWLTSNSKYHLWLINRSWFNQIYISFTGCRSGHHDLHHEAWHWQHGRVCEKYDSSCFCRRGICPGHSISPAFPQGCLQEQEILAGSSHRHQDRTADRYSHGLCYSAPSPQLGGDYWAWLVWPCGEVCPTHMYVGVPKFFNIVCYMGQSQSVVSFRSCGWAAESTNHQCSGHCCPGWSCYAVRYRVLWFCAETSLERYQATQRQGEHVFWSMVNLSNCDFYLYRKFAFKLSFWVERIIFSKCF